MSWFGKTRQTSSPTPIHPYYPASVALPNYVPNQRSLNEVGLQFAGFFSALLTLTWVLSTSKSMGMSNRLTLLWFVLCGALHVLFEGYFILNHTKLASRADLFAEAWKEYALSDSRYLTGDTFVLCAETLTATLLGPLSILTAICIWQSSPWRHPLQAFVSTAHLFSDLLYLSTSLVGLYFGHIQHCRPEPLYFWFYLIFLNGIWLVVPAMLLYQSSMAAANIFAAWQDLAGLYRGEEHGKTEDGDAVVTATTPGSSKAGVEADNVETLFVGRSSRS